MIARYLGAFIITFLLTRLSNKVFGRTLPANKTALISFTLVSILALAISSQTMGFSVGLFTYIPCLIIILAVDLYKAKSKVLVKPNV